MSRARPRRGALGLRGRIVGAVLVVTVATLGVAAIALLGPLENSLRSAASKTLRSDLRNVQRKYFHDVNFRANFLLGAPLEQPTPQPGQPPLTPELLNAYGAAFDAQQGVQEDERKLDTSIGATVQLRGYIDQSGHSQPVADLGSTLDIGSTTDVAQARARNGPVYGFQSIAGKDNVTAAIPFPQGFVLVVRKSIDEIPDAVRAVRQAFLYAVLAGLGLSLLLGVPLAARLVRRLRQLRHSALELAAGGGAVQVPDDRARDEVGDLARSFKVMQERLAHQEEARRAFVATASHELRTPLTSLEGMLELLDDDLRHGQPDLDEARGLVASARAQSRRLGRLAADLLDLSRIDAEVTLRSEPIELGELSRAVLAEFDLGTSSRGITTGLEEPGSPVWALGDPGSVARILRILLDNAVRVSPAGTEVTVEISVAPSPRMSVRDHGPGVEESERELIFERFHRGKATAGDAGFGLGLAIGRELAERMGGTLVLDPPGDGGARFTLTLHAARAAEEDPLLML